MLRNVGIWAKYHRTLLITITAVDLAILFFCLCVMIVIPGGVFGKVPVYVLGVVLLVCIILFFLSFMIHDDDTASWISRGQRKY